MTLKLYWPTSVVKVVLRCIALSSENRVEALLRCATAMSSWAAA